MNWVIQTWAYDLFTISALSFDCKQSFSKASYTITAWRSNLNGEIIEAKKL